MTAGTDCPYRSAMNTALRIRPAYRIGRFVGFSLWNGEPIGKAFGLYKHAVLALAAVALTACSSVRVEHEHLSHLLAGPPFGAKTEEDSLNTLNVIARRQMGRAYVEAGLGYKIGDGGFYGPDLTFTSRFGIEVWGSKR